MSAFLERGLFVDDGRKTIPEPQGGCGIIFYLAELFSSTLTGHKVVVSLLYDLDCSFNAEIFQSLYISVIFVKGTDAADELGSTLIHNGLYIGHNGGVFTV